jgi:hypothetical protein
MERKKSKMIIMTPDGAGGMTPVQDRRFERGNWPIQFNIPSDRADTWFQYLSTECMKRGWSCSGIQQLDAKENSGSFTINGGAASGWQLVIVWERKQNGPLKLRARSVGTPELPLADVEDLFAHVNEHNQAGVKDEFYLRGQLSYDGLPWRGELWLNDKLRLGPPSLQDESAILSARVIIVDAMVEGIDLLNAGSRFQIMLRELSVFLSVVMEHEVRIPPNDRAWVWTSGPEGQLESCDIRNLGYYEQDRPSQMPHSGRGRAIPMMAVKRPDFSSRGIVVGQDTEMRMPADVIDLWQAFSGLADNQRRKFLQAGSMWQLALSLRNEYQTARFVWMVNACEALKPPEPQFREHNIYHVAEALLGKPSADILQEHWFRPQEIRNAYLHSGEFRGSEFVQHAMMSSFQDPTFGQAYRALAKITPAAIIEWLRRSGCFSMSPLKRRTGRRRFLREKALLLLPVLLTVGAILGMVIGRLLRVVWP